MNAVKKLDIIDTAYLSSAGKEAVRTNGSENIYLVTKNNINDKEVTLEYLNEKLTYFYNNGGPIMDL